MVKNGEKEEKGCENLTNSRFGELCIAVTVFSFPILVGYHFSLINPIGSTLEILYNKTYMKRYDEPMPNSTWLTLLTWSASSLIICAFIAATTAAFLLKFISPKTLMQIAHVVNMISVAIISLGAGLTGSYEAFIIGRFLSGYACGICYVLVPTFTAEMSATSRQSFWQSFFGITISFGVFLGTVIGHPHVLGSTTLYPIVFSLASLPSIMYLGASIKFPQTPFYLLRNGSKDKAKEVLMRLREGPEEAVDDELESIEKEVNTSGTVIGIHQIITTRQFRNQLFGVLVLLGNLMLCGVNNIGFYSTLVFIEAGVEPNKARFATIGIFTGQFITAWIGTKIVERFGGVRVCIVSNIMLFSSLILFTIVNLTRHLAPAVLPYFSVFAVAVFVMTWGGGTNIATFVVIGEITIEPTRVTCMTYGNVVLWTTSWLVGFLPPYLKLGLGNYAMAPWIVCGILGLLYMCICLPNTKGQTREQIQKRLSSKNSLSSLRSTTPLTE